MNKLAFIIFSSSFNFCFAQNAKINDLDSIYSKANIELRNGKIKDAYFSFNSAYFADQNSEKGKIALHKSDSLQNLLRKEFLNEIIGVWKLQKAGSNWGMEKPIEVESLKIHKKYIEFFKAYGQTEEVVTAQKIKFNDSKYEFGYFFELIYNDNQLWRITLNEDKTLRFVNSGKLENGEIVLTVCGNEEKIYSKQ